MTRVKVGCTQYKCQIPGFPKYSRMTVRPTHPTRQCVPLTLSLAVKGQGPING